MIPQGGDNLREFQRAEAESSRTYKLDIEKGRAADYTDNLDAVRQAVYKILMTERYRHLIYSWNYGVELADLIGKPVPYAAAEIQRRITEALTQDDRIQSVDAFSFEKKRGKLHVSFTARTIYGSLEAEKEVSI